MNNLIVPKDRESSLGFEVSSIVKLLVVVMMAVILADFVSRLIAPTGTLVAQYIQSQSYAGISDPRVVEATDELTYIDLINEHPYTPWVSVNFINDGPDLVKIAINYPTALYELKAEESASVYRIGARERISVIFLICNAGEGASIRTIGEY